MSWVYLLFSAALVIGSTLAEMEVDATNQVHLGEDGAVEGRACATCHGGAETISSVPYGSGGLDVGDHGTFIPTGHFDLFGGLFSAIGGLGTGVFAIPILAVNIAILVLLAILLAHVKQLGGYGDTGSVDPIIHYAPVPSYSSGVGVGGGSTYQSYDSGAGGYSKRSTEEARGLPSPSTFQFLSKMVADAISKYSEMESEGAASSDAK
ncbi:uncharacterized protein LOC121858353 [Homarus americanus]|nr:uncharacterized protein LOC121858353 [Homarus americanus]